jgi:aryl-alcohol dehydrogenase-like predicted oxidoreductase
VIDLYQIHWPEPQCADLRRLVLTTRPRTPRQTSIHEQLDALAGLVKAGKVRAIGLSNETAWGVSEFVRLADQHGLPRVVTVQNPYCAQQPQRWTTGSTKPCTA